jgi:hypothetical protein
VIVPTLLQLLVWCDLIADDIEGLSLRLFQNNITPADDDVTGDYTVATFSGYANSTVPAFGAAVPDGADAVATATSVVFLHNGGGVSNDIYGYYVVDGGGLLVYADRFAGAPVNIGPGEAYVVVPVIRLAPIV